MCLLDFLQRIYVYYDSYLFEIKFDLDFHLIDSEVLNQLQESLYKLSIFSHRSVRLTTQLGGSSHLRRTSYLVSGESQGQPWGQARSALVDPRVAPGVKQGQPWLTPGSTLGSSRDAGKKLQVLRQFIFGLTLVKRNSWLDKFGKTF